MKKLFLLASVAVLAILSSCSKNGKEGQSKSGGSTDVDPKVKELLSKMSLEEKVGQMTQVNINMILVDGYGSKDGTIDPALLDTAVVKYKVGSLLNAVPSAYSVDQWHAMIKQIQDAAQKTPNKIPVIYGIDAIHGVTFTQNSTLFPHNIAEAATRNPDLVAKGAKVTALETRASGIRWNFDPVLDIGRNPVWARFPETFGEDPFIVKTMGVATIKAYEEDGLKNKTAVASCMKHFIGYSNPATGKDRTPAYISEIQLREYYLPQFKAAVQAGSSTIMINSGEINGVPVHGNKYLLTDVLRTELGFQGLVVSDWEDIIRLHTRHKIAATPKEAVKIAVNAGVDMSMVPHDFSFYKLLIELVNENQVSKERIDEAVGRILTLKANLGLLDNPYGEADAKANFGKAEYSALALEAAREAMTLLKNDSVKGAPVLPLAKTAKVLVAGPGANSITSLNGCWSYTWQGADASKYPSTYKTVAQAISDKLGAKNVSILGNANYKDAANYDSKALAAKAKASDYIILCLGEDAYAETPGTIFDLNLDPAQTALAKAAIATGKPVILVLIEGRPRIIKDIVPGVKGILQAYWPGSQGGAAIADVLFGDYNPNGKLPYTYPMYPNMIMTYDCKFSEIDEELTPGIFSQTGYKYQFPFGFGLSYTKFTYSNFKLSKDSIQGDDKITVSVDVTNSGTRDGKEVVEVYTRDLFASITPPQRRLRGFNKIELKAGETKSVNFELSKDDLAFVNADLKTVTEDGEFEVMIGDFKKIFRYKN
ncbi:MAG: glycoside hydrolase family 3 C-terminal domain-containing protein [Cytophagaceae bacterium]|jgi:beta-glucosidase|nr:glycoside hydrolase family 3 C-terminal domain-containing protein [Cytophagaceae bacterium]